MPAATAVFQAIGFLLRMAQTANTRRTIVELREASADSQDAVRFKACYHDLLRMRADS